MHSATWDTAGPDIYQMHPCTQDNQVEVVVAAGESSNSAKKVGNQLVIPRDLSDADLWKTLEPYVDIKVGIVGIAIVHQQGP